MISKLMFCIEQTLMLKFIAYTRFEYFMCFKSKFIRHHLQLFFTVLKLSFSLCRV